MFSRSFLSTGFCKLMHDVPGYDPRLSVKANGTSRRAFDTSFGLSLFMLDLLPWNWLRPSTAKKDAPT
jgi:hypothetical protein